MTNLTLDQQTMLATWQQHTYAEFVLKDADAALATMAENPYVFMISSGTARVGRAAVQEFYADRFLPQIPPDLEIISLSQLRLRSVGRRNGNAIYALDRNGLATSRFATHAATSRVCPGRCHPVRGRQGRPRASLLGSRHFALPNGRPRSPVGNGRC